MSGLIKLIAILALVVLAYQQCRSAGTVTLGPGIKVAEAPVQKKLDDATPIQYDDYVIRPQASFKLAAKVLSREDYSLGREADLSPTDLALGWQQMSDESVLSQMNIRQSGRWYRWSVEQFPIPRKAIETQSANMHFIPADDGVASVLNHIKQGQIIEAEGYLVYINADDGWYWRSSLTRNDTGGGACEVFYVTSLQVIEGF
jgi:hypothetical protein